MDGKIQGFIAEHHVKPPSAFHLLIEHPGLLCAFNEQHTHLESRDVEENLIRQIRLLFSLSRGQLGHPDWSPTCFMFINES